MSPDSLSIYTREARRKEVLTPETTSMDVENIMLREKSQTQKAAHCLIPFI